MRALIAGAVLRRSSPVRAAAARTSKARGLLRLAPAILLVTLSPPAAGGDAPGLGIRPPPRPEPLSEAREAQRSEAEARRTHERDLREDRRDWQHDRGGAYRQFLRERQEAERKLPEKRREDRLERQQPRPDGESLGQRLEAQRQESFERLEDRTPEQRLRPETLRRNRPGLRN